MLEWRCVIVGAHTDRDLYEACDGENDRDTSMRLAMVMKRIIGTSISFARPGSCPEVAAISHHVIASRQGGLSVLHEKVVQLVAYGGDSGVAR